jgi:hypothetical protein
MMICKFVCLKCHMGFYWKTPGDATLCIRCPDCHTEYQFYKNIDLALEPMEESE